MYYIVLHYSILYGTVLRWFVLFCAIVCIVLRYAVLYCTVICIAMYCTVLHCDVQCCTELISTAQHYIVLWYVVLYAVSYCVALYSIVCSVISTMLFCIVPQYTVMFRTLLRDIVLYSLRCIELYRTMLYCTVVKYTVWYCTLLCYIVLYDIYYSVL